MTLAVSFSNTINLGAIIITGLILVFAGLFTVRAKIAEVWRLNAEAEKERANRAEAQTRECLTTIGEQKEVIAKLQALPNLERVVNLMAEQSERSDERASERMKSALDTLNSRQETLRREIGDEHREILDGLREITTALKKINGSA